MSAFRLKKVHGQKVSQFKIMLFVMFSVAMLVVVIVVAMLVVVHVVAVSAFRPKIG